MIKFNKVHNLKVVLSAVAVLLFSNSAYCADLSGHRAYLRVPAGLSDTYDRIQKLASNGAVEELLKRKAPFVLDISLEAFLDELNENPQRSLAKGGLGFLAGETWGAYPKDGSEKFAGCMPLYDNYKTPDGSVNKIDWDNEAGIEPMICNGKPLEVLVKFNDDKEEHMVKVYVVNRNGTPVFMLRCPEIFNVLYPSDEGVKVRQFAFMGKAVIALFDKIYDMYGENAKIDILRLNEPQLAFVEVSRQNYVSLNKGTVKSKVWSKCKIVMTTHTPEDAALPRYNTEWVKRHVGSDSVPCPYDQFNLAFYLAEYAKAINAVSDEHALVTTLKVLPGRDVQGIVNGSDSNQWKTRALLDLERIKGREEVTGEDLFQIGNQSKERMNAYLGKNFGAKFDDTSRVTVGLVRRFVEYKEQQILLPMVEWICGDKNQDYDTPWLGENARRKGLGMNLLVGGVPGGDGKGYEWVGQFKALTARDSLKGKFVFVENTGIDLMKAATSGCDLWASMPRPTREACGTSDQRAALCGHLNIATNTGGPAEYIEDGVNGWKIDVFKGQPIENVIAAFDSATRDDNYVIRFQNGAKMQLAQYLTEAGEIYKNNPAKWKKMMKSSYDIANKKIDISVMVSKYIKGFQRILYGSEGLEALARESASATNL